MNRRFFTILFVTVFLVSSALTVFGAQKTIDKIKFPPLNEAKMPAIEKAVLDNGLTVYLLEDRELPLVNARVRLAAGEYLSPSEKIGLANIMGEVMRTGGTEKMTGDEIDAALEAIGASIEVNIGNTSGSASMNILSEYTDMGLQLLADILRRPVFAQDKIDLKKTALRSSIARRNDEPLDICLREFRKIIYGKDSPYARHTEYFTIDNVSRDDLVAFHKKYISPENAMLAIWGDFDKNEMLAKIKQHFADWNRGEAKVPKLPDVKYDFKPGIHFVNKDNVTQSYILLGHIGGYTGDPDYFALLVMNNVLNSSLGGRLFNNVRSKQGLAYSVGGAYTSNIVYPGVYYSYCFTKSESTVKATRSVIDEIKRIQTELPTPEEMRMAKDGYLNSFVFNFEDKGDIINRMMEYDYFEFPNDFLFKVKANVEKVTPADVQAVARKWLRPEALQIVIVGKGAEFDEPLTVFGAVDSIDVTIPTGEKKTSAEVTPEMLAKGKQLFALAAKASGGVENFKKIKGNSYKAAMNISLPQGEFTFESNSFNLFPDKSRDVIITPMGEMINIRNGSEGWTKQGPAVMPASAEDLDNAKKDLFRNLLLAFQKAENPDFSIAHIGTEPFKGKSANILEISSADGSQSFKLALDATSHLPLAKMYFGQTMTGPANLTETYDDYRDVSGVKIPHSVLVEADGNKMVELKIKEYQINPSVDESLFSKPQ